MLQIAKSFEEIRACLSIGVLKKQSKNAAHCPTRQGQVRKKICQAKIKKGPEDKSETRIAIRIASVLRSYQKSNI